MSLSMKTTTKIASVSIIVPCFNCVDTIDRAVSSVVSQSLYPCELILVDDASNDGTSHKLIELQKSYGENWIKIISLENNCGPATARNEGWEIASGKYIAFLDADDSWHPKKIEIQYTLMLNSPSIFLTGHKCEIIRGNEPGTIVNEKYRTYPVKPFAQLLSNRFLTRSVMVKREMPFRFEDGKRCSEDYLLWLEILLNGYKSCYIDSPLAYSFKSPFGKGGITMDLWKMELGELDTYKKLYKKGLLSTLAVICFFCFSLIKFIIRKILVQMPKF